MMIGCQRGLHPLLLLHPVAADAADGRGGGGGQLRELPVRAWRLRGRHARLHLRLPRGLGRRQLRNQHQRLRDGRWRFALPERRSVHGRPGQVHVRLHRCVHKALPPSGHSSSAELVEPT